MTRTRTRLVVVAALLGGVIAAWYVLTSLHVFSTFLLPTPGTVAGALGDIVTVSATYRALLLTLWEILAAFAIAAGAGMLVGMLAGLNRTTRRAYEPLLANLAAVPLVILYPAFLAVMGVGASSKVAFGAVTAFFPVALSAVNGVGAIPGSLLVAGKAMGGQPMQMFRLVIFPAALPQVRNGLRLGIVLASLAVVAGEYIGSSNGLGYLLATSGQAFKTPDEYAYIVVALCLTIGLQLVVTGLIRLSEKGEH